jgi:hypothetical protein
MNTGGHSTQINQAVLAIWSQLFIGYYLNWPSYAEHENSWAAVCPPDYGQLSERHRSNVGASLIFFSIISQPT